MDDGSCVVESLEAEGGADSEDQPFTGFTATRSRCITYIMEQLPEAHLKPAHLHNCEILTSDEQLSLIRNRNGEPRH